MNETGTAALHSDSRLPRTVLPHRYELHLEPDLGASTFRGHAAVSVEVTQPTHEVVLNAAELVIEEVHLVAPDGGRLEVAHALDEARERLVLTTPTTLDPGRWTLHVEFRGELNDKLKGFYRSVFTDQQGVEHVIATTQMEPADARRAFPCWDEPDMKATFAVTLVVPEDMPAYSNGPEIASTPLGDGRKAVAFAETIAMSTYLVAFVVGPLEATEPVDVDGVELRVIHVPGKGHLTPYALEVGAFCLRWFTEYYGIAYPETKCDLIAIPDFAAGAMENLGAITFRETALLVDPDGVTRLELERVADVVAHELAHMWFGDLVTMRWWNGLWLNEAFATFMELAAVDAFRPAWQRWVSFTNERAAAFAVDSLAGTRPIEFPVASPEDAEGMFDVLTYQKGGSVLRMLEQYLGTDRFRAGIRLYLTKHAHGNAETTDLWDAIEEATGEPVRAIMDSWIFQGGYPLVGVERDGPHLTLTQQRFRFLPDPTDPADQAEWSVPVMIEADGVASRVLLAGPQTTVDVGDAQVVVVNAGGHGFYRTRYAPALLASLASNAQRVLTPVERAILLDDTWSAVLADDVPAADFLELARGFADETDRTVWATLASPLGAIERIVETGTRSRFHVFVRELVGPALQRLTWEPAPDEDELTRQLRGTLIATLGITGDDSGVQRHARVAHDAYLADPAGVDPNVAAAALGVVASVGTEADYEIFLDRYRTSPSPQESLRYLHALGGFPQIDLGERTLAMCLTSDVRSQNAPFLVMALLANREVGPTAWSFVKEHWEEMCERYPDNAIPRMLGGVVALSTEESAADVAAFLNSHPVPQATKTIEQHLERLRVNVAFRMREGRRLASVLT
ncbi:MAG: M1 family metallopeptidase [Actinobacteria bacterium]|nr:M1 family metallopeptidase [Actinomycetota bacterium]